MRLVVLLAIPAAPSPSSRATTTRSRPAGAPAQIAGAATTTGSRARRGDADDVSDDYSAFLDQIENGIDLDPQLADSIREGKQDPGLAEQFEALASGTRPFAEKHELNDCVPDQG